MIGFDDDHHALSNICPFLRWLSIALKNRRCSIIWRNYIVQWPMPTISRSIRVWSMDFIIRWAKYPFNRPRSVAKAFQLVNNDLVFNNVSVHCRKNLSLSLFCTWRTVMMCAQWDWFVNLFLLLLLWLIPFISFSFSQSNVCYSYKILWTSACIELIYSITSSNPIQEDEGTTVRLSITWIQWSSFIDFTVDRRVSHRSRSSSIQNIMLKDEEKIEENRK